MPTLPSPASPKQNCFSPEHQIEEWDEESQPQESIEVRISRQKLALDNVWNQEATPGVSIKAHAGRETDHVSSSGLHNLLPSTLQTRENMQADILRCVSSSAFVGASSSSWSESESEGEITKPPSLIVQTSTLVTDPTQDGWDPREVTSWVNEAETTFNRRMEQKMARLPQNYGEENKQATPPSYLPTGTWGTHLLPSIHLACHLVPPTLANFIQHTIPPQHLYDRNY